MAWVSLGMLPRRLQPPLRFQTRSVFVLLRDGADLRMVRRCDAAVFIDALVADFQLTAAHFRGDMHQVRKILGAPAVSHVKVKAAPMVMLDEMPIGSAGTLVRF